MADISPSGTLSVPIDLLSKPAVGGTLHEFKTEQNEITGILRVVSTALANVVNPLVSISLRVMSSLIARSMLLLQVR